ncbi:hypothetical protein IH879_12670 [candidate division KSB1 bacterium]|nr:hypothetical protein [candidate division KSB1 bacterium]
MRQEVLSIFVDHLGGETRIRRRRLFFPRKGTLRLTRAMAGFDRIHLRFARTFD